MLSAQAKKYFDMASYELNLGSFMSLSYLGKHSKLISGETLDFGWGGVTLQQKATEKKNENIFCIS